MNWSLRYSPHVGYAPPDKPLFGALAGPDRASHVRFAAREGMAAILYPWAVDDTEEERRTVSAALRETGLECGCIVSTPMHAIMAAAWVADDAQAHSEVLRHVSSALRVANDLGSSSLAVLLRGDGQTSLPVQRRRAMDRLRAAADLASSAGVVLAIEPMIAFPGMLLRTFAEGVEFVRSVGHPGIKLIFDTGHVTAMGDPLLSTYAAAYDDIHVLQLADMPGRVEVGGGELDIVSLLAHAMRRNYGGLVDLEHHWSSPDPQCERRGIEKLMAADAAALRVAFT